MPNVAAVVAKYEAADAEPAPEAAPGVPPSPAASGAGSASADASSTSAPADASSPAETHAVLEAKLAADRNRRLTKTERRAAKAEREQAEKVRAQLEADRKEAEEAKAKWNKLGKDPSKKWLDTIREAGRDPRQVYEEMRAEAMTAGTPEARIEALEKAMDARIAGLEKELADRDEAIKREKAHTTTERERAAFVADFQRGLADPQFGTLLEEYEPPQLLHLAATLRQSPAYLMRQARELGVSLTANDGTFTMTDILSVMKASADTHHERRQRRTQSAAPQPSTAAPTQAPEATTTTVNGTAARKAGNTIGNDLAASRATEAASLKGMTRQQRADYLSRKYG